MAFSAFQVSNLVSPDMKSIQRGKFKAMKKPKKNVTKASNTWKPKKGKTMNRDNMYRYLVDHGSW